MTLLVVSLDYDDVSWAAIAEEFFRLREMFNVPFSLYQSSKQSYHIRSDISLEKKLAFEIMRASHCSKRYKQFAEKLGYFPIRVSEKICNHKDGTTEVRPAPVKLISC